MSWYSPYIPRNVWEGIAAVLIAVTSTYMITDTIKARNEAWREAYRKAQIAADTDDDGQLDPMEWGELRKRLDFQGEFGSGTLVSSPQPPREALERVVQAYAQERRVAESKIGQAAGITSK